MSPEELAVAAGYKHSTIRGIESGSTAPGEDGVHRICRALPDSADHIEDIFKTASIDPNRGADSGRPRMLVSAAEADMFEGNWHTLWQTSRDGSQAVLLEVVTVSSKSKRRLEMKSVGGTSHWTFGDGVDPPPDPPHIAWRAFCDILPPNRIGGYYSYITRPPVHGVLCLEIKPYSQTMVGYWLGGSWDSSTTLGVLVLGRSKANAQQWFARECEAPSVLSLPLRLP
jgi:transcriptional regulator with XRE-family HTH domain